VDDVTLRSVLSLLDGVTGFDPPTIGNDASEIERFATYQGLLAPYERRALAAVLAWVLTSVGRVDLLLRTDLEVSTATLADEPSTWPVVIALVAEEAGSELGEERDHLLDRLAEVGLSAQAVRESSGFGLFTAPYWTGVVRGLVHGSAPLGSVREPLGTVIGSRRRGRRRRDTWEAQRWAALRARRVARATVLWLLDRDLVDPVSGEVVSTVLWWLLRADPGAVDVEDVDDVLAALAARGLVGPEVAAERERR